jgi:hypothetical protein
MSGVKLVVLIVVKNVINSKDISSKFSSILKTRFIDGDLLESLG